jgi:methyl-accepting chemotaxis protein
VKPHSKLLRIADTLEDQADELRTMHEDLHESATKVAEEVAKQARALREVALQIQQNTKTT